MSEFDPKALELKVVDHSNWDCMHFALELSYDGEVVAECDLSEIVDAIKELQDE